LPSYAFRCHRLFLINPSASWLPALLKHHVGCQVYPLASASELHGEEWVFGQGSSAIGSLLNSLPLTRWIHSLDASASWSHTGSLQLHHADYGGVIQGSWTFWGAEPLPPPECPLVKGRTLFHVIDSSTKVQDCVPCPAPEGVASGRAINWVETFDEVRFMDKDQLIVDGRGLLPVDGVLDAVLCPLVYSQTKWVVRRLTVKELLSVFDLSESLKSEFRSGAECPFLSSAPGRLLGALLSGIPHSAKPHEIRVFPSLSQPVDFGERLSIEIPQWPDQTGVEWTGESESTTKSDDARAHTRLWDQRVLSGAYFDNAKAAHYEAKFGMTCLDALRGWFLCRWRRLVCQSLLMYLEEIQDAAVPRDLEIGRDALCKAARATWWEWPGGSTPFFWRWPPYALEVVRDGHPPWFCADPPRCVKPQRGERDPSIHKLMVDKLRGVQDKGYIAEGKVVSLTSYFAVPKGAEDIRMVYDATASGLNECLWSPNFWLPSAEGLAECVTEDSWQGDLDMGEQFLNFHLHQDLQQFCGIDVRPLFHPARQATYWLRWTRCMMGLRPSPYFTGQSTYYAEEVVQGEISNTSNPFHWKTVRLNLPGSEEYDPSLPWVSRITADGRLAGTFKRYVDDLRSIGSSEEACWAVGHRLATYFSHLGLQVALRKLRPPLRHPGPWAGTIAFGCPAGVGVTCPKDKWIKAQGMIADLQRELQAKGTVSRKPLESTRGFFIHLMRTFPIITPYLKGMHLTLDGWRQHRDSDLWKIPPSEWDEEEETPIPASAPLELVPASRLASDLHCLAQLFSPPTPPTRMIRCASRLVAIYGFVDASSAGFGSSFELPQGMLFFRHGLWGRDADSASSNFRELCNLVDSIDEGVQNGELSNSELFIFTDNTTAEGCYYKGNADNRRLFAQVLRLRKIEMHASLRLHVVHVAGTRMIHQGTDGLSRGLLTDGVFASDPMKLHVPLHLSAHHRHPPLINWVQSWCPQASIQPLSPAEWYWEGHGLASAGITSSWGTYFPSLHPSNWFLWSPPPAAARAALEELAASRHKRPNLNHIFVVPRLFTSQWRRLLYKTADVVFELPAGSRSAWPLPMHEPIVVGLTLRFAVCPPFQLRFHPPVLELVRSLHGLWARVSGDEGFILRQLCHSPSTLESLQGGVARAVLHAPS